MIRNNNTKIRIWLNAEQKVEIVRRYKAGEAPPTIAAAFGVCANNVRSALRKTEGIQIRDRSQSRRRYQHRENAFDKLTPESEYWIGFLFADGSIQHQTIGSPILDLTLAVRDRDHVVKFRAFIGSNHPVREKIVPTRQINGHPVAASVQAQFSLRSAALATALVKHGMCNKSLERVAPSTLVSSRDFWRGLVDGDGYVSRSAVNPSIGLCGGRILIEQFAEFARANAIREKILVSPNRNIFTVNFGGQTARRLIHLLYNNANVALARKRSLVEAIEKFIPPNPSKMELDTICHVTTETPFPYPRVKSVDEITHEIDRLRRLECRLDNNIIRPRSLIGVSLCQTFFPKRYHARSLNLSAFEAWHDPAVLRKAIEFQIRHGDPTTPERILRALALICRTPSVFRPGVAKFICQRYAAGGRVWDPCAGFGGRLLGAVVVGAHYIGTDVDTDTIKGNQQLAAAIGSGAEIYLCPAEEFNPPSVDLVFTSPPYFDRERYSEGIEQSHVRYKTFDEWLAKFLHPVIERAWSCLTRSGHFVINIANVRQNRVELPLVIETTRIAEKLGFAYVRTYMMPLGSIKRRAPTEPILVFRKP